VENWINKFFVSSVPATIDCKVALLASLNGTRREIFIIKCSSRSAVFVVESGLLKSSLTTTIGQKRQVECEANAGKEKSTNCFKLRDDDL
jgi:hypothetical protein